MSDMLSGDTAYLSAENGFTVFEYDKIRIRFRAPYSLERYTNVKQWDNGISCRGRQI